MITTTVTGGEKIAAQLKTLPTKLQRREARRAARAGANVFRELARQFARPLDDDQTRENIAKNIVTQESRRASRAAGGVVMRVGVLGGARKTENKAGKGNPGGDTYYWRFLEFGTRKMRARPFMRPAYFQGVEKAEAAVADELAAGIDRALAQP